ncbi:MAG: hypothetical protein AAGF53_07790 [Pseudomonadota bacterium]
MLLVFCAALAACGERQNDEKVLFDGINFRTKSKSASKDRMSFVITVPGAERNLAAARAAGEYEGTNYCVQNFGTSDVTWSNGPEAEDDALNFKGSRLTFEGRCVLW